MRRRRMADSELDEIQIVRRENRKLKQQISQLRKQISRIDVDRFQNLKELLDAQDRQDAEEAAARRQAELDRAWECWDCRQGTLKLSIIERRDGVWYNRYCQECGKRTKLQRYNDKVKN